MITYIKQKLDQWRRRKEHKKEYNERNKIRSCPSEKHREVCSIIGYYFLTYFRGDFQKTEQFINSLHITDVRINNNGKVIVCCARPGLFIGRKGIHCEAIKQDLGNIGYEFDVYESFSWNDFLAPFNPDID